MIYIITYVLLIFSVFADTFAIHRYGSLKGCRKLIHLAIPYSIIGLSIILLKRYDAILFLSASWWTLKDMAMGYILKRNIFYMGTGWWDRLWDNGHPQLLLGLKAMLMFFGYSFIINF